MILALKQEKPILEFELGNTVKSIPLGDTVRVCLSNAYPSNYFLNLQTALPFKNVSDFIWEINPNTKGNHSIVLFITTRDKTVQKYSNTLTINVT